ncbi:MAG: nuclear transport factor 2 family protein [Halobacteriota archaeon]
MPDTDAIRAYYEYVDAGAIDDLVALFADDIVYERPGHAAIEGIADFRRFYEEERPIGESNHAVDQLYVDGETVIVRGRFEGTLAGEAVAFGFADFHRFNGDGEIEHRWTYTDLGTV